MPSAPAVVIDPAAAVSSAAAARPTVVLLHGLARTCRSLHGLRRFLEHEGYATWARTYPSRQMGVAELAREVSGWIRADVPQGPVVAVTHSLGGILVRHMQGLVDLRGALMLAPPNRGSRVALAFRDHPLYRRFYGPAGQQVVSADAFPPPPCPFAVVAGTSGLSVANPVSWVTRGLGILPPGEPSDGTVTVAETRLEAMADFATVAASHTWIMNHPETRRLVLAWLAQGRFA